MSTQNQPITPDHLLQSFRGRSLKSIILFTVIAHIVIIGGTSVPYFLESFGKNSSEKLSEEQRTEIAAREATDALRKIAEKNNIKPQDLSARIAGGAGPKSPAAEETAKPEAESETPVTETTNPAVTPETTEPEKPKSAIEQELDVKQDGPTVPEIKVEEAADEDLFGQ
ncbi:MAG: hypothetical protein RL346_1559 [Verrucomicrobiota bacterium]|jgi:hypothetical protein